MTTKLLLMGGTFDPPHFGHMQMLENAIRAVQPDEVLIVPAGLPPHKAAAATGGALRMEMCACFHRICPGAVISDMEIRRGGKSFTWDTVRQLKAEHRARGVEAEVSLCVGSDMLMGFLLWRNALELLREVVLVAALRRREDEAPARQAARELERLGGRVLWAPGEVVEISSSRLRGLLAHRETYAEGLHLLPLEVASVVIEHRLYAAG